MHFLTMTNSRNKNSFQFPTLQRKWAKKTLCVCVGHFSIFLLLLNLPVINLCEQQSGLFFVQQYICNGKGKLEFSICNVLLNSITAYTLKGKRQKILHLFSFCVKTNIYCVLQTMFCLISNKWIFNVAVLGSNFLFKYLKACALLSDGSYISSKVFLPQIHCYTFMIHLSCMEHWFRNYSLEIFIA